jgi:hypothetical protein
MAFTGTDLSAAAPNNSSALTHLLAESRFPALPGHAFKQRVRYLFGRQD